MAYGDALSNGIDLQVLWRIWALNPEWSKKINWGEFDKEPEILGHYSSLTYDEYLELKQQKDPDITEEAALHQFYRLAMDAELIGKELQTRLNGKDRLDMLRLRADWIDKPSKEVCDAVVGGVDSNAFTIFSGAEIINIAAYYCRVDDFEGLREKLLGLKLIGTEELRKTGLALTDVTRDDDEKVWGDFQGVLFGDPVKSVRENAIYRIGNMPPQMRSGIVWSQLSLDKTPNIRVAAATQIGTVPAEENRVGLMEVALSDPEPAVRLTAVKALGSQIFGIDTDYFFLEAANDTDVEVRMEALRFLDRLSEGKRPKVIFDILNNISDKTKEVRKAAVDRIVLCSVEYRREFITQALHDPDPDVRFKAVRQITADLLEVVQEELLDKAEDDENEAVRDEAKGQRQLLEKARAEAEAAKDEKGSSGCSADLTAMP